MKPKIAEAIRRGIKRGAEKNLQIKQAQFQSLDEIGNMFKRFLGMGDEAATSGRAFGSQQNISDQIRKNIPDEGTVDYEQVMRQSFEDVGENPNYVDQLFE